MIMTNNGTVIDPVTGDLKLSIPKMKAIPEICPMRRRNPFDVPSETGKVTSAPYWNPIGPELRRKNPKLLPKKEAMRSLWHMLLLQGLQLHLPGQ